MNRRFLAGLFLSLVAEASVAHAATNEISVPFEGVRLIHSRTTVPRQLDMWIAEIDTAAAGIDFLVTPSNGALPGDTTRQTTRSFVTGVGAQLGINANFFAFVSGNEYDVRGLSASNGDVYSHFEAGGFRNALNIAANNVATIIRGNTGSGTAHTPPTALYNAVGGNARLVTGGINVAGDDVTHPRTAVGVTADGKLLLLTVDGRNAGHSEGVTYKELADILIRWGAHHAINLDGGGSTTFVLDNPLTGSNDPSVLNIPSDLLGNGQHGKERLNGNNLAVFAQKPTVPSEHRFVFADFEQGDVGVFNWDIGDSGSNRGFDKEASSAAVVSGGALDGNWFQRISIVDDPQTDGDDQNPDGAWFARHVAGSGSPANNVVREAIGSVGFWARTTDPNLKIALVVDDASGATGERGLAKDVISDGAWHRYFWDLADSTQWEGWVGGDGTIGESFTLDSIHIFGAPTSAGSHNAIIDLDAIMHITPGAVAGDFNGDYVVDAADYLVWRRSGGSQADYAMWRAQFGKTSLGAGAGAAAATSVPEPASLAFLVPLALCAFCRRAGAR